MESKQVKKRLREIAANLKPVLINKMMEIQDKRRESGQMLYIDRDDLESAVAINCILNGLEVVCQGQFTGVREVPGIDTVKLFDLIEELIAEAEKEIEIPQIQGLELHRDTEHFHQPLEIACLIGEFAEINSELSRNEQTPELQKVEPYPECEKPKFPVRFSGAPDTDDTTSGDG